MKRGLIDTIIEMIEENISKEVILKVTKVEEYLFNQIKIRYHIKSGRWHQCHLRITIISFQSGLT